MKQTETHYSTNTLLNGTYETIDIIQEENVKGRSAIKVKFFEERWREPKEVIALLKLVINTLEEDFI